MGFALLSVSGRFRRFSLSPGIELVMGEVGFDARLRAADLVITGEGRIDAQTAYGKTAYGVARLAASAGVPCLAVGGSVTPEGSAYLGELGCLAFPVVAGATSLTEAMRDAPTLVALAGERLAGFIDLWSAIEVRSKDASRGGD